MKNNTINKIKVEPCTSNRTGEAVKNQYIITIDNKVAFQSYSSLIAVYDTDIQKLVLGRDFDYSRTTSKYLNQFIYCYCYNIYRQLPSGKSTKDILYKAIEQGIIQYDEKMI